MSAPIRVLFAIGSMQPGGSERQVLTLLQNLCRQRYAPEIYLIRDDGKLQSQLPADVVCHCYQSSQSDRWRWLPGSISRAQARHLASVLESRSIEIVYDRTFHMTLLTAYATRLRPTRRISTIVGDPRQHSTAQQERFAWLKRQLLRRAYQTADVAAIVSEGLRPAVAEYYRLPPDTFTTFYNLFDTEQIARRAQEPIDVGNQPAEGIRIVAVGRLSWEKGFDQLIDAVRQLLQKSANTIEIHIDLVGDGPEQTNLQRQAAEAGLSEQITFHGYVENPLPWIRLADIFCLPSRFEGMPNALVEAILCETPVVATDCPSGPREILENGRWGLLVPTDSSSELAQGLSQAIAQLPTRSIQTSDARRSIEERFSVAAGLARFDAIVAGLLARS